MLANVRIPVMITLGIVVVILLYFIFPGLNLAPSYGAERHFVPLDQIVSGGPPPDGIPAIDNPKFVPAKDADFDSNSSTVIGVYYNGQAKAYPLSIMVWHEVVNDIVGGKPLAVTYCPLCYSVVAYVREINGVPVTFGTSGRLYNNNLVMYDRLTRSLWSQIWGAAIAGNLTGYTLQRFPVDLVSWGEWHKLYPDSLVLSSETGYSRPYSADPYGGYYANDQILFPLSHTDSRLALKKVVLGLTIESTTKAYSLDSLIKGVIDDSLGSHRVTLLIAENGWARVFNPVVDGRELHFVYSNGSFIDKETNSVWSYDGVALSGPLAGKLLPRYPTEAAFWFAWTAFNPDTQLFAHDEE